MEPLADNGGFDLQEKTPLNAASPVVWYTVEEISDVLESSIDSAIVTEKLEKLEKKGLVTSRGTWRAGPSFIPEYILSEKGKRERDTT